MQYGNVPGIDKPVSRIVQGTTMVSSKDLDNSFALLDAVFERGCNTFDTAHVYGGGDNERTVGRWVRERGLRSRVVIIGKGAHHNADRRRVTPFDIAADIHDSLARFGFEYIDLYILHRDDPSQPVGPIVEALNEHLSAGRIKAFGGSNWTHRRLAEANAYAESHGLKPFVASSPNFSLADQVAEPWPECVTISGPRNADARAWYAKAQLPVFSWSSLASGFFSGRITRDNAAQFTSGVDKIAVDCNASEENWQRLDRVTQLAHDKDATPAQIAVAWVLHSEMNLFPLLGPRTIEEFDQNAAAMDIALTDSEAAWLDLQRDSR